jgi:WXG100 family type VII secretion target
MAGVMIKCDFDQMSQVIKIFKDQDNALMQINNKLSSAMQTLAGGDWCGRGAKQFYAEMEQKVMPSLGRLAQAMEGGAGQLTKVTTVMQQAEQDSRNVFKSGVVISGPAGPGSGETHEGPGSGEELPPRGSGEVKTGPGSGEMHEGPGSGEELPPRGSGAVKTGPGSGETHEGPGSGEELPPRGSGAVKTGPGSGETQEGPGSGEELPGPGASGMQRN